MNLLPTAMRTPGVYHPTGSGGAHSLLGTIESHASELPTLKLQHILQIFEHDAAVARRLKIAPEVEHTAPERDGTLVRATAYDTADLSRNRVAACVIDADAFDRVDCVPAIIRGYPRF